MQIDRFSRNPDGSYLMNYEELAITAIVAVPGPNYRQSFAYIEAAAMEPTGLYPFSEEAHQQSVKAFGYAWEEYGLFRGTEKVTREEYDDGAVVRGQRIIQIAGESELRVRYTTPYNFLIAANGSPINNPAFDSELEAILNRALKENRQKVVKQLAKRIHSLPLRSRGFRASSHLAP